MKYLLSLLILLTIPLSGQELIINEVMSDNEEYIPSFDGLHHDWIEIYNPTDTPIQLSSYYLSDDADELDMWQFPTATIEANDFMIIYASGLDTIVGNEIHTNFGIDDEGEAVTLSNINSEIVDSMNVPKLYVNDSYGNFTEENRVKTKLGVPTPSGSNDESGTLLFSHESGFYDDKIELEVTAAPGAEIYYTIDGSIPDETSRKYEGKIELNSVGNKENDISNIPTNAGIYGILCYKDWEPPKDKIPKTNVLRFRAMNKKTYSKSYFIGLDHDREFKVASLVTNKESLFDPDSGIYIPGNLFDSNGTCKQGNYYQRGKQWERLSHLVLFDNNREKLFSQNLGIRIHGSGSRSHPHKSLRLYARGEYGKKKFNTQLLNEFEVEEYDSFIFRASMNCWNFTMFKDELTTDIVRNLDLEKMYFTPVILYINGEYWGIHQMRNRLDENFLSDRFNIKEDSINIAWSSNVQKTDNGSNEGYKEIYNFIKDNDISKQSNFEYVQEKIDLENYIEYMIVEIFFRNLDWPANNNLTWNANKEGFKKWRWLLYDMDASWQGWLGHDYNMMEFVTADSSDNYANAPEATIFFRKLLENNEFRNKFTTRAFDLLDSTFTTKNLLSYINKFKTLYEKEIDNHILRWNFPESKEKWKNDIARGLESFAKHRPCTLRKHLVEFFDLSNEYLCDPLSVWKDSESEFEFYPNPTNDKVTIITIDHTVKGELQIIDVNGRVLLEKNINSSRLEINIEHLSSGVYFIKFGSQMKKLIKL